MCILYWGRHRVDGLMILSGIMVPGGESPEELTLRASFCPQVPRKIAFREEG